MSLLYFSIDLAPILRACSLEQAFSVWFPFLRSMYIWALVLLCFWRKLVVVKRARVLVDGISTTKRETKLCFGELSVYEKMSEWSCRVWFLPSTNSRTAELISFCSINQFFYLLPREICHPKSIFIESISPLERGFLIIERKKKVDFLACLPKNVRLSSTRIRSWPLIFS